MRSIAIGLIAALVLSSFTGCAPGRGGTVYTRDQARVTHDVSFGTVRQVDPVTIEGTRSGMGVLGGAIAGGVLGSLIGGGRGSTVGAVGGALGGAAVGGVGEEAATRRDALEITVELDNGRLISIVQEPDEVPIRPGDRVRVLTARDGSARVRQ
jgi:outer membrane lipoprotein SlyB